MPLTRVFPSSAGHKIALRKALTVESPKSQEYRKYQCNFPIYDGCYDTKNPTDTIMPLIQLFPPAFPNFLHNIMNQD
jgi:hypothetical protein